MTANTNAKDYTGRIDFTTAAGNVSHFYKLDGERVPGVTTIINGGVPKPGLISWAAEQAAIVAIDRSEEWLFLDRDEAVAYVKAEHERVRDAAGARGTHMHEHAEQYLRTGVVPPDVPEDAAQHIVHLSQFLEDWRPVPVLLEFECFNRTHRYAGTGDAIVTFPDKPEWGNVLIDYKSKTKTSVELRDKPYPVGPYAEVAMQLVAYRRAEFYIGTNDFRPMAKVDRCAAVCVYPDGYTFHEVDAGDVEWDAFLSAKAIYEWGLRGRRKTDTPVRPALDLPPRLTLVPDTSDPFEGLH